MGPYTPLEHPQASRPRPGGPAVIASAHRAAARPAFGARPIAGTTGFRVWAPSASRVSLLIESGAREGEYRMVEEDRGVFSARVDGVVAGILYRFRLDDRDPLPDPASR